MSALNGLACMQKRRDEVPNRELASNLVATNNKAGIKEIADHLWDKDRNVANDCIKVLYEVGYLRPELVAGHVNDFITLVQNKNNRLVWGGMLALSTVAALKPQEIFEKLDSLKRVMKHGSVITLDNGVKTLALVAAAREEYSKRIFPFLIDVLRTCRAKSVPQYSESVLAAVNASNRKRFVDALTQRLPSLSTSQAARVRRVLKQAEPGS